MASMSSFILPQHMPILINFFSTTLVSSACGFEAARSTSSSEHYGQPLPISWAFMLGCCGLPPRGCSIHADRR